MIDLERLIAHKRARAAELTGEAAASNARRLARLEAKRPAQPTPEPEPTVEPEPPAEPAPAPADTTEGE